MTIDCFVNAVYVYDNDKIVVTLNYKNSAKPVSKQENGTVFGSTMSMGAPVNTELSELLSS